MRIITSGSRYIDIDAYGGCVAYAELLNLQGTKAKAASNAVLNASVPPVVQSWNAPCTLGYAPAPEDTFAVLDVSEPEFFDTMVNLDMLDEVIDHHPGREAYWQERIGDKADIEFAGAVCTMIYERWNKAGLLGKMSVTSARLLICGILDNTLNFGAEITTDRDRQAYQALLAIADLPGGWAAQYFEQCGQAIVADIAAAIRDDSKQITFAGQPKAFTAGQLAVWNGRNILDAHLTTLEKTMPAIGSPWFVNVISISEGKSHFICNDQALQHWLSQLLHVTFTDNLATANRLWLRKEIMKAAIEQAA